MVPCIECHTIIPVYFSHINIIALLLGQLKLICFTMYCEENYQKQKNLFQIRGKAMRTQTIEQ